MLDSELVAFAVVAAVVTVVPGVDMALVVRNVLTHGRGAGYVTGVGVCTGLWVSPRPSACRRIILTSAALFSAVKLAGALYLVTLGVTSLWRAIAPARQPPTAAASPTSRGTRWVFAQGLLSNLLNPKGRALLPHLAAAVRPAGR